MYTLVVMVIYCLIGIMLLFVCVTHRKQYDDAINTVSITVHSALCYNQEGGALINIMV